MPAAVARKTYHIARPLKTLVPLIQEELSAASEAGLEHYRTAGVLLVEAKESGQVPYGSWGRWLSKHFELSARTARRYMRLAGVDEEEFNLAARGQSSLQGTIGEGRSGAKWKPFKEEANKVDVQRLAHERQTEKQEVELRREMAQKLIDLGYRAMAVKLHPDRGGSKEAMARLSEIRDELKSVAAQRRFV